MNTKPRSRTSFIILIVILLLLTAINAAPAQTAVEAWVQRYSHTADSSDSAQTVATDNAGNVIVAGSTDDGVSRSDFLTIKYSDAGVPLWTNRYNGPGNSWDNAKAVAVDGSGNVFVTGGSTGSGDYWDYATIKYSGAGLPLWTNRYDGPGTSEDYAYALAVDGSGNVFVTGSSGDYREVGNFLGDYVTVAYSGGGLPLWTNRYSGPGYNHDYPRAVAVDGSGNVFVTGVSGYYDGPFNFIGHYVTVAYSGVGRLLWTNRYDGGGDKGGSPPGNRGDYATAVAVDGTGNVFVIGESWNGSSPAYATIAYSGAGLPLWTNRYSGPGNIWDKATAAAVDGSGNVFVTGSSWSGSSVDYATVAYSGAGLPLWTNRYNGPGDAYDEAKAVAVDGSGNVFVTGRSASDYATVAYSGAGLPLWTNRYNNGQAIAIAADGSGNVFVTGTSGSDYVTIKYSPARPRLTIEPDGDGGHFLRFDGIPGSAYRLQRATNINATWDTIATQTASASGKIELRDPLPPPTQAFYRVRAE